MATQKTLLPPTFPDEVEAARIAFNEATAMYIAALNSGDPENIRLARRALQIALANFLRVMADEPAPSPGVE